MTVYETSHSYDLADMQDVLDVNRDGNISNADLQSLVFDLAHGGVPSVSTVPEPTSFVLAMLGALAFGGTLAMRRMRAMACAS